MNVQGVIIDPQNDFVLPPPAQGETFVPGKHGALSVPGAEADMKRLAKMLRRLGGKNDDIHVTLDSHQECDVAHPIFWKDPKGNHPAPFTIITAQNVRDCQWTPSIRSLTKRMLDYTAALEKGARYPLCIWPPHCLIGTPGTQVYGDLREALGEWARGEFATVDWVTKGSNPYVEHYSAVQAEVPDPDDPSTLLNKPFISTLEEADIIWFAGEALSHCLKSTMEDIFNNFSDPAVIKKCVLLTDAASSVIHPSIDFPAICNKFIADMKARGMQVSTTVDFLK